MRKLLDSLSSLVHKVSSLAPLFIWFVLIIITTFIVTGSLYFVNESRIVPAFSIVPLIITTVSILIIVSIAVLSTKLRNILSTILRPKYVLRFSIAASIVVGLCISITTSGSLEYLYDSLLLTEIAKGSGSSGYLSIFPHNIPLVLLMRLIAATIGPDYISTIFIIVNTLSVSLIIYAIYKITSHLFRNDTATTSATLLTATFIPFIYYIPHLYGDLSGVALTLFGVYYVMKIVQKPSPSNTVIAVSLLSVALLLKGNTTMPIIIIFLLLLSYGIYRKSIGLLASSLFILIIPLSLHSAVLSFGISHYSLDESKELPKTVWVAMGLKYGDRETSEIYPRTIEPGTWAPGITGGSILSKAEGLSTEEANNYAREIIKKELLVFLYNPTFAFDFFTQKIVATWNNQSFEGPDRLGYSQKTQTPEYTTTVPPAPCSLNGYPRFISS